MEVRVTHATTVLVIRCLAERAGMDRIRAESEESTSTIAGRISEQGLEILRRTRYVKSVQILDPAS